MKVMVMFREFECIIYIYIYIYTVSRCFITLYPPLFTLSGARQVPLKNYARATSVNSPIEFDEIATVTSSHVKVESFLLSHVKMSPWLFHSEDMILLPMRIV